MAALEVLAVLTGGVLLFLLTLLCFSLRDFSRSRLEDICQENGQPERFGDILQSYERALLLSELQLLLFLLIATWLAADSTVFGDISFPEQVSAANVSMWLLHVAAVLITVAFVMVVLPWTLSRVTGEKFLYRTWPVYRFACNLFSPVWTFASHLDRIVHRIFSLPEPDSDAAASLLTEELLTVVDESRREGVIQSNASTMIHRVVDLQTEDVAAIMTPRTDMVTIDADLPLNEAYGQMLASGFSRVPVIRDGIDDIVGILYSRDLLACALDTESRSRRTTEEIARDVLYAPESQGIGDLLESMRARKVHMAIVVDEYSGVSGLVTLEDILEEIVGDISDEYDTNEDELWKKHQGGVTEVDARFHLDDLNDEFHYEFPEDEEYDTIGGFVLACFGRIPAVGDQHHWKELRLTVLDADERQLKRVQIEDMTDPDEIAQPKS